MNSRIHFTPVRVALKVREWLGLDPDVRMLDVGSGCGKFCLILAASGPGSVAGIEQRPDLHMVAQTAARSMGLSNASFLCGRMEHLDWSEFNTFYFYNPFFDQTPFSGILSSSLLTAVEDKLNSARSGSRVITYHGMGGPLPEDWRLTQAQEFGTGELVLWVKS
jgi:predicted RNA methylase